MKNIVVIFVLSFFSIQTIIGQELLKPSEDKSLVYITRTTSAGALINFRYFDGDKYIGKFNGRNYVVYECEPGEHLFWANAENRDFIPANLVANKVYMIHAGAEMGMVKARINLHPVDKGNEKLMKKINKLFTKKQAAKFIEEDIAQKNIELKEYIKISLQKYEDNLAKGKSYTKLSTDMTH